MMETKTFSEISGTNSTMIHLIVQEDMIVDFILYDCTGGMSEEQLITNSKVSDQY
jgi:hypothetical protein